jgi:hypothetical protein
MTSLVDPKNDIGDLDGLQKELTEAVLDTTVVEAGEAALAQPSPAPVTDALQKAQELAGKYEGKSAAEVADMHRNLESAYGRMANDLGTQRKLTDRLLDLKRTDDLTSNSPDPVEVSSTELLDNPTQALDKYLSSRESQLAQATDQRLAQMENSMAQDRFTTQHPDHDRIANDPAFAEYLNASPLRTRLAQMAVQGDWSVAADLMTEYKSTTNQEATAHDPTEAARQVGLETPRQSTEAAGVKAGKVYRRADLIRLKLEKPDVYEDPKFQDEILRAYAEGRVK